MNSNLIYDQYRRQKTPIDLEFAEIFRREKEKQQAEFQRQIELEGKEHRKEMKNKRYLSFPRLNRNNRRYNFVTKLHKHLAKGSFSSKS